MSFFTYISNLWENITESVVGGVTYTVDWFQQLGNAVGSATGRVLQLIFQPITDFFAGLSYGFKLLVQVFDNLLALPVYVYTIVSSFFTSLDDVTPVSLNLDSGGLGILTSSPIWTALSGFIIAALGFFILYFVYRAAHH